jgi:hypothetical protein
MSSKASKAIQQSCFATYCVQQFVHMHPINVYTKINLIYTCSALCASFSTLKNLIFIDAYLSLKHYYWLSLNLKRTACASFSTFKSATYTVEYSCVWTWRGSPVMLSLAPDFPLSEHITVSRVFHNIVISCCPFTMYARDNNHSYYLFCLPQ